MSSISTTLAALELGDKQKAGQARTLSPALMAKMDEVWKGHFSKPLSATNSLSDEPLNAELIGGSKAAENAEASLDKMVVRNASARSRFEAQLLGQII